MNAALINRLVPHVSLTAGYFKNKIKIDKVTIEYIGFQCKINKRNMKGREDRSPKKHGLDLASFLLVCDHSLLDHLWNLHGQPRSQTQGHGMGNAKLGSIARPQGLEMISQTNFASTIHFGRFAIQLWQRNLRGSAWISHWNVKFHVKLVFQQVVDVPKERLQSRRCQHSHDEDLPTLAKPSGAFLVGLETEPISVGRLVVLHVGNQALVLLFEPLKTRRCL